MKTTAILTATLGLALGSLHAQTVPPFINYQGTVTDSAGLGLGTGTPVNRKVIFRIFDAATGGNRLWSEQHTVTISDGQFSVLLGNGINANYAGADETPLKTNTPLDTVFTSSGILRYVEIVVDNGDNTLNAGDAPIAPRQQITSTAYSFRARSADTIASGSDLQLGTVTATSFSGDGSGLTNLSTSEPPTNVFPAQGMVWIKPGTFLMGSRVGELGRSTNETQHPVTLTKGFWMGVHEVTQAEYTAVIGSNPSFFIGNTNRPVETVSWNNAVAYCAALTTAERTAGRIPATWEYRLPTEAEWEYCCRAGARTTRFGYGDDLAATALGDYAWTSTNSGSTTHPVEQKRPNAWGLMDMHGNVFEWCLDSWDGLDYPGGSAAVTDPRSVTGSYRVLRGGGWGDVAGLARCAGRGGSNPPYASGLIGFRAVLAPGQ